MISAVFILNQRGEVIIFRLFRDDVTRDISDVFKVKVLAERERSPVYRYGTSSFLHIKSGDVYIVAVTRQNVNTALAFQFLYSFAGILKAYFRPAEEDIDPTTVQDEILESQVKANFTLIYELLDEVVDFGYPQNLEVELLKQYITQQGLAEVSLEQKSKATIQATGAVGHRMTGLKYKRNEMWIDVIESVNIMFSQKGAVLRSDASGRVMVKAYLTGMPECKLGLNDKVPVQTKKSPGMAETQKSRTIELDDCTYHQCVRLNKLSGERAISFIPPDGEFELMRYRITENVQVPFKVYNIIREHGKSRVEYKITVKSTYSAKLSAVNLIVRVPTPPNTAICKTHTSVGKAKYGSSSSSIEWRIKQFSGQSEALLSAEVQMQQLTDSSMAWSRPPITLQFSVSMYTASGINIRYMRVFEKSNYETFKWVRYLTKNGQYQHRI